MKIPFIFYIIFMLMAVCTASVFFLLRSLRQDRELAALIGLSCMAMGIFLLLLDLALISFTIGPQHIPDYLLFNRPVADTGFAGRWMLTVYVFLSGGPVITIYLLARKRLTKFNKSHTGD